MIRRNVKKAVKKLSRDEITEQEFKQRLNQLKQKEGGNAWTISGAISGVLGDHPYTEEFCNRVRQLAVEADEDFKINLSDSGDINGSN